MGITVSFIFQNILYLLFANVFILIILMKDSYCYYHHDWYCCITENPWRAILLGGWNPGPKLGLNTRWSITLSLSFLKYLHLRPTETWASSTFKILSKSYFGIQVLNGYVCWDANFYFRIFLSVIFLFPGSGGKMDHILKKIQRLWRWGLFTETNLFLCIILACNSPPLPKPRKPGRTGAVGVEEAYYHGDGREQMVTSSKAN